jgi:hypothetical protein
MTKLLTGYQLRLCEMLESKDQALFGHGAMSAVWSPTGEKRKRRRHRQTVENDPKATSAESLAAGMIPLTTGLD